MQVGAEGVVISSFSVQYLESYTLDLGYIPLLKVVRRTDKVI